MIMIFYNKKKIVQAFYVPEYVIKEINVVIKDYTKNFSKVYFKYLEFKYVDDANEVEYKNRYIDSNLISNEFYFAGFGIQAAYKYNAPYIISIRDSNESDWIDIDIGDYIKSKALTITIDIKESGITITNIKYQ